MSKMERSVTLGFGARLSLFFSLKRRKEIEN